MLTKNIDVMKAETAAHIAARAVRQGQYWERGRGCFIGCLTHSDDANAVTDAFGMPQPLVKIAEIIFEGLSPKDAKSFFAAVPEAIERDGKDLSRVYWLFLDDIMRNLPPQTGDVKAAIDRVIDGIGLLSIGEEWPAAAYAAFEAHAAAYAAEAAAYAAACAAEAAAYAAAEAAPCAAAAYAADAAADAAAAYAAEAAAEVSRQRDVFLRLLREAK